MAVTQDKSDINTEEQGAGGTGTVNTDQGHENKGGEPMGVIGLTTPVGLDQGLIIGSTGHTTMTIKTELDKVVGAISFSAAGIKASVVVIPAGSRAEEYTLAADVIAVSMRIGQVVSVASFINATDVNQSTFPPIPVQLQDGGSPMLLDRYPSEIYDDGYELILRKAVGGADSSIIEPVVLRNYDSNATEWLTDRISKQLSTCLADVQIAAGVTRIATAKDLAATGENILDASISNTKGVEVLNEYGIPSTPTMRLDLTVKSPHQKKDVMGSLNTGGIGSLISQTHVTESILFTGSELANGFNNRERYQSFSVNLTMGQVESKNTLNFNTFMLSLAGMASMASVGVMMKAFDPATLGVLELEVNSAGQDTPGVTDPKDMVEHYGEYFQKYFKPDPLISITSTPGTTEYSVTALIEAAYTDQTAHDILVMKLNELTDGKFSEYYQSKAPLISNMEYVPMGTFQDPDGKTRSLDTIDLLYVMNAFPGQAESIKWVRAMSGSIDPIEARALKLDVINRITAGAFTQLDHCHRIYVNGEAITALVTAVKACGINFTSNSSNFNMVNNNLIPFGGGNVSGVAIGSSGLFTSANMGNTGSVFQHNTQFNGNRQY